MAVASVAAVVGDAGLISADVVERPHQTTSDAPNAFDFWGTHGTLCSPFVKSGVFVAFVVHSFRGAR